VMKAIKTTFLHCFPYCVFAIFGYLIHLWYSTVVSNVMNGIVNTSSFECVHAMYPTCEIFRPTIVPAVTSLHKSSVACCCWLTNDVPHVPSESNGLDPAGFLEILMNSVDDLIATFVDD
jgi:hypothetical protein